MDQPTPAPGVTQRVRAAVRPRTRLRAAAERIDNAYARALRPIGPGPRYSVLAVGIYREDAMMAPLVDELRRSSHDVRVNLGAFGPATERLRAVTGREHLTAGKFQNMNTLLPPAEERPDWLLVIDDDVAVPPGFLDDFLALCDRYDFALAQPAQDRTSHANWPAPKRHFLTAARTTRFVEIGPITALRRDAQDLLLPFPADLRYGWGLDFSWAHDIEQAGLSMGIVDLLAVTHASRAVASTYSWQAAQDEAREFLATVPHLPSDVAEATGRRHRWPGKLPG